LISGAGQPFCPYEDVYFLQGNFVIQGHGKHPSPVPSIAQPPSQKPGTLFMKLMVLCIAMVFGMVRCSGTFPGAKPLRTLHVKVVVNPSFSSTPQWQAIVFALFEKTNNVMREGAGIVLQIDTMCVWDIQNVPSHRDLLVGDCLVKEQPRGKSDIVLYFTRIGNPPALISAMTLYELGYAYIQQPTTMNPAHIDDKTVYSLVHWLGHLFGAAHCYFNRENVTVMNPFVHDGIIMEPKTSDALQGPEFHKGNLLLMQGLSWRPFEEKEWSKNEWPKIKRLYERIHHTYNHWKISPDGELSTYENDAFHEGNLLLYLSSWASLCGYPDKANAYLDTLSLLYGAITSKCMHEGVIGKTRICAQCGYEASEASSWLEQQNFHIAMRRAVILLRKGDSTGADRCFADAIKKIPDQLAIMKDKYSNGYSFYKERYCKRRTPGEEAAR
jgi:hypothetical protein